jgi:toxin CptA
MITALQITIGFMVPIKSYAFSWLSVGGGILLGLGAYKNKACAVGTISRIGDGNLNYLFTPIGMLISVFVFYQLNINRPQMTMESSIVTQYPIAFLLISLMSIVLLFYILSKKNTEPKLSFKQLVQPTTIVAICFVLLILINTRWSYTELINDFAKNNFNISFMRVLLFLIFFAAVILGGLYFKTFQFRSFKLNTIFNCIIGGALIGFGSQLVVGSHDTITLYGFPLLLTTAVIVSLTNFITISLCIKIFG